MSKVIDLQRAKRLEEMAMKLYRNRDDARQAVRNILEDEWDGELPPVESPEWIALHNEDL